MTDYRLSITMITEFTRPRTVNAAVAALFCLAAFSLRFVACTQCEPVRISLCLSMPYNRTRMPNLLHHSTQENANLAAEQFELLAKTRCSDALVFFLCALHAPICAIDFQNEAVPPCRSVCERARAGCEPLMNRYNVTWPQELECEHLPQYDRGVCVTPEAIVSEGNNTQNHFSTPPVKSGESFCRCPDEQTLTRKVYMKRRFDYVIQAKVKSVETLGELTFTQVQVEKVIKHSRVAIQPHRLEMLWTISACACPRLTIQSRYIILGYEDSYRNRLFYKEGTLALPVKDAFLRKIQKWEESLQKRRKKGKTEHEEKPKGKRKGKKTTKAPADKKSDDKSKIRSKKHHKSHPN